MPRTAPRNTVTAPRVAPIGSANGNCHILASVSQSVVTATRDLEWGIPVPLPDSEGKVLYVWFDAPIGYISATKEWAEKIGEPERWKDYWKNPECEVIHFIGKDNIVFHAIFFPAVLMAQEGYNLPSQIPANEFLNLEGRKLSTSRDYAVWVPDYLKSFAPDILRYTLAANLPENKDADFSWKIPSSPRPSAPCW